MTVTIGQAQDQASRLHRAFEVVRVRHGESEDNALANLHAEMNASAIMVAQLMGVAPHVIHPNAGDKPPKNA